MREAIPDNDVASLQEELAAAKLREAEANLALKDLKAKVADLSTMWKKHLQQRSEAEASGSTGSSAAVPSTPKKLLGSFLENGKSEVARLEEELMTARLVEVENEAELKASRLKVMELETQVCVVNSIYRTRAIISRGLYIFYPISKDHFFVFKEVFSENSVLMYGLYSRAASNQERLMMARVR